MYYKSFKDCVRVCKPTYIYIYTYIHVLSLSLSRVWLKQLSVLYVCVGQIHDARIIFAYMNKYKK